MYFSTDFVNNYSICNECIIPAVLAQLTASLLTLYKNINMKMSTTKQPGDYFANII